MLKRIFAFLIFLTLAAPASASSSTESCPTSTTSSVAISTSVRITALYPNPNTGENEWIELTNTGSDTIDLSNYTLEDATAHPWAPSGSLEGGEAIEINGFSFQLNNTNETVTLKTSDGTLVDTWTYSSSTKGVILYRDTPEVTDPTSDAEGDTENASTNETPVTTPSLYPAFSEAMPNPEGSDSTEEWIELYNPYEETLILDGLQLDDGDGGSTPHTLSGNLEAESYLLLSIQDTHINLNNTEDHVRLLGINDEVLWDYPYTDPEEGYSLIVYGSGTAWSSTPTPGEENVFTNPETATEESSGEDEETSEYQNGDSSEEVTITEVFPNPEGPDNEDEWIELTNGGDVDVNLGNWTLMDASGKTYTFSDSTVIHAGETLVLYRPETSISLNNSNESLTLTDFSGEVMSEVSFESSQEDESYSEIQIEEVNSLQASTAGLGNPVLTVWQWVTPSPGIQNPIWKQIKGSVTEFDGKLLTLFDGLSTWTFTVDQGNTDTLLYEEGNTLLVQATLNEGLYEVMHAELIEKAIGSVQSSFPWSTVLSLIGLTGWGSYELYKRRKSILKFGPQALN